MKRYSIYFDQHITGDNVLVVRHLHIRFVLSIYFIVGLFNHDFDQSQVSWPNGKASDYEYVNQEIRKLSHPYFYEIETDRCSGFDVSAAVHRPNID